MLTTPNNQVLSLLLLGKAWASPISIITMGPAWYLQYVPFTPYLSHPGSQDLPTAWNACILVYWCVLRVWRTTAKPPDARNHCLPWRLSTKTGRQMCRHIGQTDWAYWGSRAVVAPQNTTMPVWNESQMTDDYTHCTDVLVIIIDIGATLKLLQCLWVSCWMLSCTYAATSSAQLAHVIRKSYDNKAIFTKTLSSGTNYCFLC